MFCFMCESRRMEHMPRRSCPSFEEPYSTGSDTDGGGEDDDGSASAPLHRAGGAASGSWRRRRQHHEGCPGCRLDEANKADTGVPYRNFSYIWAVCLAAGEFPISLSPPA